MNKTLQNKIDAILNGRINYDKENGGFNFTMHSDMSKDIISVNKAIQELREEIKWMEYEKQSTERSAGYNEALFDVLALIGEKG